ncbi:hypothetical protein ACWDUC_36650 [Streptomyces tricolor]|uniref:hypothetical protein n=1 Tax=Streptomyces sp. FBKL.4005 TaxID=2015515 RepID=UPI000B973AC3|nr:hypothetical protein [Streptomyces sp. FBKL.4005]OYP13216.1 hypothetical protein CFC35_00770 [Streptomyces sp. FBKL.4005]
MYDLDVKYAGTQPIAAYSPQRPEFPDGPEDGAKNPEWCPLQAGPDLETKNPDHLPPDRFRANYRGSLETVGQARTRSPWGTLDQIGNAVEWTGTIDPILKHIPHVVRRMHGRVSFAEAYQLNIAAVGPQPQAGLIPRNLYPRLGFRAGLIGNPGS